jgi:hypothetical protein
MASLTQSRHWPPRLECVSPNRSTADVHTGLDTLQVCNLASSAEKENTEKTNKNKLTKPQKEQKTYYYVAHSILPAAAASFEF